VLGKGKINWDKGEEKEKQSKGEEEERSVHLDWTLGKSIHGRGRGCSSRVSTFQHPCPFKKVIRKTAEGKGRAK